MIVRINNVMGATISYRRVEKLQSNRWEECQPHLVLTFLMNKMMANDNPN